MNRRPRLVILMVGVLALASLAAGQSFERATLQGVVNDASGAPMPGVSVTVRNVETNLTRETVSAQDGRFVVPGLAPGTYDVRAELAGFRAAVQAGVQLQVGQTQTVNFLLEVGAVSEEVTVVAESALVETTRSDFSRVVGEAQIDNLPINGRNFLDFATLTPGVVLNQSTAINGIGANVGGARSRNGSVMVDGFNNLDDNFTSPRLIYSQEAIREFQVLTLGYAAEFGRATGGIVNAVTKSGTNRFEGRAFYYYRDKALNARNAFETGEKADFRRYQWGGIAGGPIVENRAFYFGSFERQDFNSPTVVTISPGVAQAIGLPASELGTHQKVDDTTSVLGKVNFNPSGSNTFEFTAAYSDFYRRNLTGVGGLATPSSGTGTESKDYLYAFKWSRVFAGGRLLNEFRASYNPRDFFVIAQGEGPRVAISGVATYGRATNSPNSQWTDQGQIINHVTWNANKHDVKFGVDMYPVRSEIYFPGGEFGSYSFPSLDAFLAGNYNSFSQAFGENTFVFDHQFYAFFVQDSWRVLPRLTVNAGLRYEYERQPSYKDRKYPEDTNNLGPRLGFAWDTLGDGRAVVRAHVGLFFDKNFNNIALNTFRGDGVTTRSYAFQNRTQPGAPAFPNLLTSEPDASRRSSLDIRLMVEDPSIPQAWQSSTAFEYALGRNMSATVSYLRNDQKYQYVNLIRNRFTFINGVRQRPDPTVGAISVYDPSGKSRYNAMTLELTRRMADNYQFNVSYTLGDAKADSNDFGSTFIDENNRQWDYGPTPDDVRHNLVVSGSYVVPRLKLNVGGIFRYNSGRPYSASAGADLNQDGVINDRAPGFTDKPNSFRGDTLKRLDLRLTWRPSLGGRAPLELIGEVFNVFNDVYYTSVNTVWGNTSTARATFGTPLTAADPRVIQLGARFTF